MIGAHHVDATRFEALAGGGGGADAVRDLARAQLSRNLLLLKYIVAEWPGDAGARTAGRDVLVAAQRQAPQTFTTVMGDPMVGAWAAATVRRIRRPPDPAWPVEAHLGHLGALAAAAAVRCGLAAEVPAYAWAGRVTFPGLGTARVPADGPLIIRVADGRLSVPGAACEPTWHRLRRLRAGPPGHPFALRVEDDNPYRGCYHASPATRLSEPELAGWRRTFGAAADLLATHLPHRLAELRAGLQSVVPLVVEDEGVAKSGTARDAFGALGLTLPRSPEDFAVTLVHEFQHSKLSALLGVIPLYADGGAERHFAPWRPDPRPTGGLLQGVYAFLAVAETWHLLRAAPGLERTATRQFAQVRAQVRVGLSALAASAELTTRGRTFVAGLGRSLQRLLDEAVPAWAEHASERTMRERTREWERHNERPVGGTRG